MECETCGTTAVTDNNGFFLVPNKVPSGRHYAVRIDTYPPSGYTGAPQTTTTTCSWDWRLGTNMPYGSVSYEDQPADGLCASGDGGCSAVDNPNRCNFIFTAAPTPTPTSVPPTSTPVPSSTPTPTSPPLPTSTPYPTSIPGATVVPGINLQITQPPNTLTGRIDLSRVIAFIFNLLVAIGIIAALAYLMYGAIKWITSGGDKAAVEAARSHIVHAVIGLLILVLSWVIVSFVLSILGLGSIPSSITIPSLTV